MSENPGSESPRDDSTADQEQVKQWLAEAETAAKAEEWDKTIALYRKALEFDRFLDGVEAKLQWALRMRDIDKLYRDGKAKLEAGEYEAALVPLRKARVMYASHYKDVDDLIIQAQTGLQQQKWDGRPEDVRNSFGGESQGTGKRSPVFFIGTIAVVLAGALMLAFLYLQGNSGGTLPTLDSKIPRVNGSVKTTPSGLQIISVQPGTGAEARAGSTVSVHYTGYLTDGRKFDSSIGRDPFVFPLGRGSVIPGWDEGLLGMKVGEKRRLIIPPQLGYGAEGEGSVIPPNATLVFDVELMQVQ